jgi:DNA (cytosine-5)-methyltransferase 1
MSKQDRQSTAARRWPTAIDLFCGAGGLTVGLKRARFRVLAGVELDPLAGQTYRDNHPRVHLWQQDIRSLSVAEIRRELGLGKGQLDLLAGCPPCQGFSTMRTRNSGVPAADERNELVLQFVRLARGLRPKAIMLENVPGLAKDERFAELQRMLSDLGYEVGHRIRNAADFGVPQRRRRLILLATRSNKVAFPEPSPDRVTVKEALKELRPVGTSGDPLHDISESRGETVRDRIRQVPKNGGSRSSLGTNQLACHATFDGFHDVYGRMHWDRVAPTITSGCINPSKGRFLHPEEDRAITLREAAILQGFPRKYQFRLTRGKYKAAEMIGNALPPDLVRIHALELRRALTELPNVRGAA